MHKYKMLRATVLAVALPLLVIASAATAEVSEATEQLARNALALEGKVQRGAALFATQCAGCHGAKAQGDAARLVPSLAGQRRAYLVKQLADFAMSERVATQMHAVIARSKVRDPQAWADVALYLNGMPVLTPPAAGKGADLALGEASYQQQCASCHEADARGDDDGFVPALRNQHYAYLLHEMRALAAGRRCNVDADLRRFLDGVAPQVLAEIADYLTRLHGPVRDRARLQNDGSLSD